MYILFGVITMIVIMILEFFWRIIGGFSILESYICVGSFFVGVIVSGVMTKALVKFNKKATKTRILICILMGAATFIAINYMEYKIDNKYKSSFVNYIEFNMDNKTIKYIARRSGHRGEVNTKGLINYIIFSSQFIAVVLGGFVGNRYYRGGNYCDECKKYYVYKTIFTVKASELYKISRKGHINVSDIENFKLFVQSHKLKEIKKKTSYIGTLVYCNECKKGKLIVKKMISKEKSQIELNNAKQIIDVDAHFVESISLINIDI